MNHRERTLAVLHYQPYDRLPIVHFGFWQETLEKWAAEGHLSAEDARTWGDGNPTDARISEKLGFDFNYACNLHPHTGLRPEFDPTVIKEFPDGSSHIMNGLGVVELHRPGAGSIPAEIDHRFKGRKEWEELYKPRLQFTPERVTGATVRVGDTTVPFLEGGLDFLTHGERTYLYNLYCGSLYGFIRNFIGIEQLCYLTVDDEDLFTEIIDTVADLSYQCVKGMLESGAKFDCAHFWEDICYKNGPLVSPGLFAEKVGPHYRRISALLHQYGINIISVDCDGMIDALIPTWLENGVNTMFPIEVGTWNASIIPWRERYGRELRGIGGMNKVVFARDRAAIDAEIERLKPQIELGGFIPCPDHRIPPDAEWENVRYYCERMRETF